MLKERITLEERVPQVSSIFRASEVGECETYLCHQRLGHEPLPFTGRVRHMLDDGITHEHDIISRLRSAGITVLHSYVEGQTEVHCSSDPRVSGHPDGVLEVSMYMTSSLMLDYADEHFKVGQRFYLLEVTAPNHFTFLRIKRSHLREILWRKFVQMQMYLNSEEIRSYSNCSIAIVKNKNTSELYEEGISLDADVVGETLEKLKTVEHLVSCGSVSDFRCSDWRRNYCRYRHLCFEEAEESIAIVSGDILRGESLSEAEVLQEAAEVWRRGRLLELEGKDLISDSRDQFKNIIEEYGCKGLTIADIKALMIAEGVNRRTNYDLLRQKYFDVYDEVVSEVIREAYVRVTD